MERAKNLKPNLNLGEGLSGVMLGGLGIVVTGLLFFLILPKFPLILFYPLVIKKKKKLKHPYLVSSSKIRISLRRYSLPLYQEKHSENLAIPNIVWN